MKIRTILLTLATLLAGVAVCFAADVNTGTWKLNEAKSKVAAGAPKNSMVVIAAAGDSMKVTVDGVGADGKPSHNTWTGKFDGKDYAITGDPASDMRAYKPVDDHTLALAEKKGGKVTNSGKRCRLGRRQDPHGHRQRIGSDRQKGEHHFCLRQAVETGLANFPTGR